MVLYWVYKDSQLGAGDHRIHSGQKTTKTIRILHSDSKAQDKEDTRNHVL